jgi:solute carrier family 25 (mitochondrial aspartate/glutamate transporter), member 12/13
MGIVREIGVRNMFRGSAACLLRDVSFSVLYFGIYHPLRHKLGAGYDPTFSMQLLAGTGAGSLASSMTTPFDVIKTRLQAQQQHTLSQEAGGSAARSTAAQQGNVVYKGVIDCGRQIVRHEGVSALFHGIAPRLLIISPLFGITFLMYENLVSGWLYAFGQ